MYFLLRSAGSFNPNLEDPLPGQMKKQLVLKIISGQQLPKPKDSMLGDRGEVGHSYTSSLLCSKLITHTLKYINAPKKYLFVERVSVSICL